MEVRVFIYPHSESSLHIEHRQDYLSKPLLGVNWGAHIYVSLFRSLSWPFRPSSTKSRGTIGFTMASSDTFLISAIMASTVAGRNLAFVDLASAKVAANNITSGFLRGVPDDSLDMQSAIPDYLFIDMGTRTDRAGSS